MRKKLFLPLLSLLAILGFVTGCGGDKEAGAAKSAGKTTITFWAAPNPPNLKYWQEMAKDFEAQNDSINVEVTQMKESPTSEAGIQSAIASNTAPTLSENITRSFGAQLKDSKAVVDFTKVDGYSDLVKGRNMMETIENWKFSDGGEYVIPLSASPIMLGWRKDILAELGFNEAPKTYSDVLEVGKKLKEKYPDKFIFSNAGFTDPTAWLRWLDFFPFYEAASGGANFVAGDKYVADEKATKEVFEFISTLKQQNLVVTEEMKDPFETGNSLATFFSPANLPGWNERYPELVYNETFYVTPPTYPDALKDTEEIYTYGNAKGVVLYAQASKEEQKAAMEFLRFVFGNPENDRKLLEITSSLPSRDDALTNEAFTAFYKENPVFESFAQITPFGTPAMDNGKFNDVQEALGEEGWIPAVQGKKKVDKAWKDMSKKINETLNNE